MKIVTLGPKYSFSETLASKLSKRIVLKNSIKKVFEKVSKEKYIGLVPLENIVHGTVRETINYLKEFEVKIIKQIDFPINLCIASKKDKFNKVISKKEALSQCQNYLEDLKDIRLEEATSTSNAMVIASKNDSYAAIGSLSSAKENGLNIIKENIQDNKNNQTRFILISKKENQDNLINPKTSILITPKKDYPGLLYEVLSFFKEENINLTKIESIPTKNLIGEYEFFIEIEGNSTKKKVRDIIEKIGKKNEIKLYGSYELEKIK